MIFLEMISSHGMQKNTFDLVGHLCLALASTKEFYKFHYVTTRMCWKSCSLSNTVDTAFTQSMDMVIYMKSKPAISTNHHRTHKGFFISLIW